MLCMNELTLIQLKNIMSWKPRDVGSFLDPSSIEPLAMDFAKQGNEGLLFRGTREQRCKNEEAKDKFRECIFVH